MLTYIYITIKKIIIKYQLKQKIKKIIIKYELKQKYKKLKLKIEMNFLEIYYYISFFYSVSLVALIISFAIAYYQLPIETEVLIEITPGEWHLVKYKA